MTELLSTEDFKELLASGVALVHTEEESRGYVERANAGDGDAAVSDTIAQEKAWWEARGLDHQALVAYCVWEADDTLTGALRGIGLDAESFQQAPEGSHAVVMVSPMMLKAMIAATAETAFSVGWHMHDRLLSKVAS